MSMSEETDKYHNYVCGLLFLLQNNAEVLDESVLNDSQHIAIAKMNMFSHHSWGLWLIHLGWTTSLHGTPHSNLYLSYLIHCRIVQMPYVQSKTYI